MRNTSRETEANTSASPAVLPSRTERQRLYRVKLVRMLDSAESQLAATQARVNRYRRRLAILDDRDFFKHGHSCELAKKYNVPTSFVYNVRWAVKRQR